LLAVPSFRDRYLEHVRTIAQTWLDWKTLGPMVAEYRSLIERDVETDTRKLTSTDAFRVVTADESHPTRTPPPRGRASLSLRDFAQQRREFLLEAIRGQDQK
jgi:hypothetical protein